VTISFLIPMRKIIAVLISLIFLTVLAPTSLSDTEDINVTLTPSGNISINVDQPTWGPSVGIGGSLATDTDWANLDNDGNVQVDVTVNATDTAAWTLSTAPGHDLFQMQWGTGTPGGEGNLELTPNGVYSSNECWAASSGTLDEAVASADSDYISYEFPEMPMGGAEVYFTIPDHTTETGDIINVTIYGLMSTSAISETTITSVDLTASLYVSEGAVLDVNFRLSDGQVLANNVDNTEPQTYTMSFDTDPYEQPWTWAAVDALTFALETASITEDGTLYVEYMYATVYYDIYEEVLPITALYDSSGDWSYTNSSLLESAASNDSDYVSADFNDEGPVVPWITFDLLDPTPSGFVVGETAFCAQNASDAQEGLPAASVGEISNVDPQYFSLAGQYRGMEDVPPYDYYYRDWTWGDIDNIIISMVSRSAFGGGTVYCDHFFARVYYETPAGVTWTDIALTPTSFVNNLAWDQSQDFGLQVFMPTSTSSSANQTSTITFTATAD